MYLFGYLTDDFFGRVVVAPSGHTVAQLAKQLTAWSWSPEAEAPFVVTNEAGAELDADVTIADAGLGNGDIFTVRRSP
jgi:hypothetical protein